MTELLESAALVAAYVGSLMLGVAVFVFVAVTLFAAVRPLIARPLDAWLDWVERRMEE